MTPAPSSVTPPFPDESSKISRRRLLQRLVQGAVAIGVASVGGLAYAHEVEPSRLRINRRDIRIAGLPRALDGLMIAHLTDLHLNHWMTSERLSGVMRTANSLGADLMVITGDFVSKDMRPVDVAGNPIGDAYTLAAPGLSQALSILRAPLGVWAVLGNHDHWTADPEMSHTPRPQTVASTTTPSASGASTNYNVVRRLIREAGVGELDNKITPIERGGARLWLCGVDDLWAGQPDFPSVIDQLEQQSAPDEVAILLAHEPDYADIVAQTGRVSLQLSGHSHGGQVNIPFIGPPILPIMGRKYHTGLYQVPTSGGSPQSPARDSMQVFTSRGVGIVGIRVRFNCPPEIALLTLRSA
jgi:predicted MPP superfamily phosphohydrolase